LHFRFPNRHYFQKPALANNLNTKFSNSIRNITPSLLTLFPMIWIYIKKGFQQIAAKIRTFGSKPLIYYCYNHTVLCAAGSVSLSFSTPCIHWCVQGLCTYISTHLKHFIQHYNTHSHALLTITMTVVVRLVPC